MNIKKILSSKLLNHAELAKRMYPTNKEPASRLHHKLTNSGGQRMLDTDYKKIEDILRDELGLYFM